jgi:hypothetical protein
MNMESKKAHFQHSYYLPDLLPFGDCSYFHEYAMGKLHPPLTFSVIEIKLPRLDLRKRRTLAVDELCKTARHDTRHIVFADHADPVTRGRLRRCSRPINGSAMMMTTTKPNTPQGL